MRAKQRSLATFPEKTGIKMLQKYNRQRYGKLDKIYNAQKQLMGVNEHRNQFNDFSEEKRRTVMKLPKNSKRDIETINMKNRLKGLRKIADRFNRKLSRHSSKNSSALKTEIE